MKISLQQSALAFPVVVFAHKLENNSRKVMDISECIVHDDGELEYLIHFAASFAAFAAAFCAATSSLLTPNWRRWKSLSIAQVQMFMIRIL